MRKIIDLTNQKFNSLFVIKIHSERKNNETQWFCVCDCGNQSIVRSSYLRSGHTKSCGCLQTKHRQQPNIHTVKHNHCSKGKTTQTYTSWSAMKSRCYNANDEHFHNYGGRGIKVCDRWLDSFENFLADMGERPKGMTLDRIDNNGNYEPENCRWADAPTQKHNSRQTKLTPLAARVIKYCKFPNYTQKEIGAAFNISDSVVSEIKSGKLWRSV